MRGKIIAVTNQKGGVGKTTTAVNLAACLAWLGVEVLLVDTDPQSNTTSGVGVALTDEQKSIYDLLVSQVPAAEAVTKTVCARLSIIPSRSSLTGAEVELVETPEREFILKKALLPIKNAFDFIIIDCPPSLGLLTINALTAADAVLVPIQCEYYALEGVSLLNTTIDQVRKGLNTELAIEGILLTMGDPRTNLTKQVIDEVRKFFQDKVYETMIPRNIRLSEAPSHGKPIIAYDEQCFGSQCYLAFAKEVMKRNGCAVPAAKPQRKKSRRRVLIERLRRFATQQVSPGSRDGSDEAEEEEVPKTV